MTTRAASLAFLLVASLSPQGAAGQARETPGPTTALPGIRYQVLASGPAQGPHPKRSDSVTMRYVGRLETGEVFSTSPDDGKGISTFAVNQVIPGMSAALQLMRPGDRWRITMPPYLAYGPGRPFTPPPGATGAGESAAAQAVQKRGIPPDATLIFDVDLVGVRPPKAP